ICEYFTMEDNELRAKLDKLTYRTSGRVIMKPLKERIFNARSNKETHIKIIGSITGISISKAREIIEAVDISDICLAYGVSAITLKTKVVGEVLARRIIMNIQGVDILDEDKETKLYNLF